MGIKNIEYPFTESMVRDLKSGEMVNISGLIFTGRDRLHKYLFDGGKAPVDLKDGAIYHCGPVTLRKDGLWMVRAAGPTTSIRLEPYISKVIEQYGIRIIIGKGGMGDATRKACSKFGCVYLQTVGGAAALQAEYINKIVDVHFLKEFSPTEAMWVFNVKDFKAIVTMDSFGKSVHKKIKTASGRALTRILHEENRRK